MTYSHFNQALIIFKHVIGRKKDADIQPVSNVSKIGWKLQNIIETHRISISNQRQEPHCLWK